MVKIRLMSEFLVILEAQGHYQFSHLFSSYDKELSLLEALFALITKTYMSYTDSYLVIHYI